MLIPRRTVRTSPPQHAYPLNTGSLGAKSFIDGWAAPFGYRLITNKSLGAFSGVTRSPQGASFSGASKITFDYDIFRRQEFIFAARIKINVLQNAAMFCIDSRFNIGCNFESIPGGEFGFSFYDGSFHTASTPDVPIGKYFNLVVCVGGGLAAMYIDEKLSASTACTSIVYVSGADRGSTIGAAWTGAPSLEIDLQAFAYCSAGNHAFARSLSGNIWQIFEDEEDYLFIPASAVGSSVSPYSGNGIFYGKAPSVAQTANRSVTPNAAHGSFYGKQPTVQQTAGQVIAPNAWHSVFAGYSPSIVQPHTVSPGTWHEVFSGYAPTVTITAWQVVSPAAGHAIASGKHPVVIRTDNRVLLPVTGRCLFSGKRPTVSTSSVVYVRAPDGYGAEVISATTKRQQNISKQLRPANIGRTRH